jgi:hypothetical protein
MVTRFTAPPLLRRIDDDGPDLGAAEVVVARSVPPNQWWVAVTLYWVKVAVTMTLVAEALNEQGLVPGQAGAPVTLQPTNVLPGAGVGVSFTMTLRVKSKLAELQAMPQLMPRASRRPCPDRSCSGSRC